MLASCRSALDLVAHYHERVRSHPTKGRGGRRGGGGRRSSSSSSKRPAAPSYAEVAALEERVAGARARLEKLAEVVRRRRGSGSRRASRSEDEER